MYSKLRCLVLEYLGIPPSPSKQSSDMEAAVYSLHDCAVGLPFTERRGQSAPLPPRRSWSRPSITDSCEVMRSNMPAAMQTHSPPQARGTVVSQLIGSSIYNNIKCNKITGFYKNSARISVNFLLFYCIAAFAELQ